MTLVTQGLNICPYPSCITSSVPPPLRQAETKHRILKRIS